MGAGAAAGALAGLSPQRATAVLKLDVTSGNVQPMPIAVPDFVSVATQDPAEAHAHLWDPEQVDEFRRFLQTGNIAPSMLRDEHAA